MTDKKILSAHVPDEAVDVITACQEWHAHRIAQLKSLVDTPEDTKIVIEAGGERLELEGKVRGGFLAGIQCAIELFEKFPLTVTKPSKEFIEGSEAWCDGQEIIDCPYESGTDGAVQWIAGWNFENEAV